MQVFGVIEEFDVTKDFLARFLSSIWNTISEVVEAERIFLHLVLSVA